MKDSLMIEGRVDSFFAFARERHSIYLRRQSGDPWPWTADSILQKYKFTNIFRELDRTTVWFREHVRDSLQHQPEVLLATVLFRWFCKQEIGEVIFGQGLLLEGGTPWTVFLQIGDTVPMHSAILSAYPRGPFVTGAYMLRSPTGMSKLNGMLHLCSKFWNDSNWREVAVCMAPDSRHLEYFPPFKGPVSMKSFTRWLQEIDGMGPFLAYEVACDLQYTDLLRNSPDIMTWANVGPGCRRGLNRLSDRVRDVIPIKRRSGRPKTSAKYSLGIREEEALLQMRELLQLSQDGDHWPTTWWTWDMRTVEHTLCEFDKYQRALHGDGEPKQLYRRA